MCWVYGKMLLAVHQVCDAFSAWCEGCPCRDGCTDEEQKHINALACWCYEYRDGTKLADGSRCHRRMHGRRAWEMASGALDKVLKEAFGIMTSVIMTEICTLDEAEQEKVLADMEHIKAQCGFFATAT